MADWNAKSYFIDIFKDIYIHEVLAITAIVYNKIMLEIINARSIEHMWNKKLGNTQALG